MDNNIINTIPQKGYKKSAIGVIPADWKVMKLGELSDIRTGKKDNQNKINDGLYPFFVRSKNIERINSYSYDGEAILIPGEGNIGEIFHYINGKFDYHQRVYKISDFTDETIGKFIYYYFQVFFLKETIRHSVKATVDSLRLPTFTEMVIHLPQLSEQQKIAEILSTWDDAIATCKKTIDTLEDRNKGLALQLLTGKKRICKSNVKWEETTIEKITKYFSNKNKELIDARIYSVTNSNGFVYQSDHFSREVAGDDLTGYKIIRKNEFAYNPARINVGSIAFFTDEIGIISSLYVCFKTNDKVLNEFFIEWLKIEKTKHDIERYGEGGVRIYLWYDLFKKLKISLPSIEEQNAIVDVLATANQELKSYQDKLEALQLQKKGLMQQLLTGKIRVNVK